MNRPLKIVGVAFVGFLLLGCYAGGYKKGYAAASAKDRADQADSLAKYGNDFNSDPSLNHSPSYNFAYTHGKVDGAIEARQKDVADCGDQLARLVVRFGDPREAGRLLASGQITTEQLQESIKSRRKMDKRPD